MPIIFRCKNCRQRLSITSRKAGTSVTCPSCKIEVRVPTIEEAKSGKRSEPAAVGVGEFDDRAAAPPPVTEEEPPPAPPIDEPEELSPDELETEALEELEAYAAAATATAEEPEMLAPPPPEWFQAEDDDDEFTMRKADSEFEEMDLTPMVDVTFLLLIFFMITASFSTQKTLDVPPPEPDEEGASQAVSMEDLQNDSIIVEIDEKNTIFVDEEPLGDPEGLVDKLQEKMRMDQKAELVLEAHEKALHEYVVLVVDAANEVKMQRIRIATRTD